MEFRLHILGSASALPAGNRYPSAHVLSVRGRFFLFDCGEGCQTRLRRAGISILKIDSIFISHIHGDHIFGFFGLVTTMAMLGRTAPLAVYAPRSFEPILKFTLSYFGEGMRFRIDFNRVKASSPEIIAQTRSLDILAFPLDHRIETYGYMVREKEPAMNVHKSKIQEYSLSLREIAILKSGNDVVREDGTVLPLSELAYRPYEPRSFAYCCDTAPFAQLSSWIGGVSLLLHEATYMDEDAQLAATTRHSTASQAATCAADAGAGKLVIGHFSSRYRNLEPMLAQARAVFPETVLAKEGDVIEIPLKR